MREGIDKVLNGELKIYTNEFLTPSDAMNYLEERYDSELDIKDDYHNGWELDAWYDTAVNGKPVVLKGSAYNGGLEVYLGDEDEEMIVDATDDEY